MSIKEVVKSRSVRVNLGDYQSTEFFVSMRAECLGANEAIEVGQNLSKIIERSIVEDIVAHFKARGKTISTKQICQKYGLRLAKSDDFTTPDDYDTSEWQDF